jgi:hypothetical protein
MHAREKLVYKMFTTNSVWLISDLFPVKGSGVCIHINRNVCGIFTMQIDGNGVVTFDPDLNSGRPAYRIENRHRGEHSCTVYLLIPSGS